ncbi:unnamed protein product [Arctia plantaginis]|uniref:Sodium channel protein Nach n=1 Tax=Arctia plantaginis TaxID=874455 RepID=A0A8S1A3L0_ARCPL|nr:unnamed protein product [Arctia plantaginis]
MGYRLNLGECSSSNKAAGVKPTSVETTHYSMDKVEFPAVTVCDSEKVFLPRTHEITELLTLRGYNQSDITEFYKSFSAVTRKDYEPAALVKKMHSVLDDLGYSLKILLNMFQRPCDDLIMECNWRSQPYNCSQMFKPIATIVGHCCQFDIPFFRENTNINTNYISGIDTTEALDIVVMGPAVKIDPDETDGYAMLYVYDRQDKVTLIDSFINLTPESFFDVNIYTWVIDSSENVKALPLASRKCILETDKGIGRGFYQSCMTRMILKKVVNYCKCLPFDFSSMVQVDIKEIISENECYQRCDYVQYDTEVEYVRHQRRLSKENQSASRVQVHFAQMTCMKYRREILYTWDQMLANLGGIFGLCLGGSIISVIELVWFVMELLFKILTSWFKKPVAPQEKKQVFIVSQKNLTTAKPIRKMTSNGKYKFIN